MPVNISLDLRKLGDKLPAGLRGALRRGAKAAQKPLAVADTLAYLEELLTPAAEHVANPIASARVKRCTIRTRAHILGIADLPALGYQQGTHLPITLFRVRVERPDGDAETCVRQHFPAEIRRLAPGSSVRALAHDADPRIVVLDWRTTGRLMGMSLTTTDTLDQYAWPDADKWPAPNAIEARDNGRHTKRLAERRAQWSAVTARLTLAQPTGGWLDDRQQVKLGLDVGGRVVIVKERVPELALAKLVGYRPGESKLGKTVTTIETVAAVGAPIAALVSPAGDVAVDWEATLNHPEMRATG